MKVSKESMLLYAITDRKWLNGETLACQVEKAIKGGATIIQLRDKSLDEEAFLKEAVEVQKICKQYNIPLIINDNVEVALKIKADGVHVGQSDMEAGKVREKLGPEFIIGVSSHNVEEAVKAEKAGADYLGAGAVFPTGSKDNTTALSRETLKAICEAVSIPVVAIGGISAETIHELKGTKISGVAVISAIFAQEDIKAAAADLKARADKIANND